MQGVPAGETRYARNGEVSLAYKVVGEGPVDAVWVPGFISHVELNSEIYLGLIERLASFCRLLVFDKRGTGLSDRSLGLATLEDRVDDVRAVMDAAGMDRAALIGVSEGGPMSILMAASHPDRVTALALYGSFARIARAPDYPEGVETSDVDRYLDYIEREWGTGKVFGAFVGIGATSPGTGVPLTRGAMARFERYSCTPAVAREIMRRNFEIDVRSALPLVATPSLIVHCLRDPIVLYPWGEYLAEQLPGARLVTVDDDFHGPPTPDKAALVIDPIEEFLTGHRPVLDAHVDRVLATVMFTDIVGSTEAASRMGDRAWRDLLDRHDAAVRDELARHRGTEVNTTGDGFLATFDGPARAIRCALAIADRARALGIEVRAGVHTGECERRGDDLAGIAVHIGARVLALAGPGEVLVSSTVRDLVVGSGLEFDERGSHVLKGVPGEWRVLAVRTAAVAA